MVSVSRGSQERPLEEGTLELRLKRGQQPARWRSREAGPAHAKALGWEVCEGHSDYSE